MIAMFLPGSLIILYNSKAFIVGIWYRIVTFNLLLMPFLWNFHSVTPNYSMFATFYICSHFMSSPSDSLK